MARFSGHEVRLIAEEVVKEHGGSNQTGKYDRFVNAMYNLFKETLLSDKDKLKQSMNGYWSKYNSKDSKPKAIDKALNILNGKKTEDELAKVKVVNNLKVIKSEVQKNMVAIERLQAKLKGDIEDGQGFIDGANRVFRANATLLNEILKLHDFIE